MPDTIETTLAAQVEKSPIPSLGPLLEADIREIDNLLQQPLENNPSTLETLKKAYQKLENQISIDSHKDDILQAILRIRSGHIILKAKSSCKYGSWEVFATENFDMNHEERKIRQKVSKIENIDKYYSLGWKRLKALAKAVDIRKFKDPVDTILKGISYTIDITNSDDVDMFKIIVDAYVVNESSLKPNGININLETVVDAIECDIDFNEKLINKLKDSKQPGKVLYNMIDFETFEVKIPKQKTSRCRELAMILEKFYRTAKEVVETDYPLSSVELFLLEDAAHFIKILYERKMKEIKKEELEKEHEEKKRLEGAEVLGLNGAISNAKEDEKTNDTTESES
jgi:hypothetical protein